MRVRGARRPRGARRRLQDAAGRLRRAARARAAGAPPSCHLARVHLRSRRHEPAARRRRRSRGPARTTTRAPSARASGARSKPHANRAARGQSMTVLVVAEKPSVARDIAQVLGARTRARRLLPRRRLRRDVGDRAPRRARRAARDEPGVEAVAARRSAAPARRAGRSSSPSDTRTSSRSCGGCSLDATCAASSARPTRGAKASSSSATSTRPRGAKKPVSRLWISSLTPDAIRDGFRTLRDGQGVRPARRRGARAEPRRLARGDEPVARVQRPPRRQPLGRARADADARDDRRARARDPRVRAGGLPRGRRDVRRADADGDGEAAALRGHVGRGPAPRKRDATGASRPTARRPRRSSQRAKRGRRADRVGRAPDAAHSAAAALRSHRAPAPRQPPLRLHRAAHARDRADALRAAQAPQLSAHGQPPPLATRSPSTLPAIVRAIARAVPRAPAPRDRRRGRSGRASSTTRASPTTTPSSRPGERRPPSSRPTSARSTISSAGACSRRGTGTTSTP